MDKNIELENIASVLDKNSGINFIGIKLNKNIFIKSFENNNYYIVGNDYEDEIGINEKTLELYILSNNKKVYVNSSLDTFINCIKYFMEKINLSEDNYKENERHKVIKEIRNGIKIVGGH
jgi:hypothetical protein